MRIRLCEIVIVMTKTADEVLAVRVPPALKRQLRKMATEERRTLSNLVEYLLVQMLDKSKERVA